MTDEQKAETAEAFRAYLDGETEFEYLSREGWRHTDTVNAHWPHRRKPKPALVPWDCKADVPLNAWIRNKNQEETSKEFFIHCVSDMGVFVGTDDVTFFSDLAEWEHSTDRVNWHPCSKPA